MPSIDLNCDMGESFGAYSIGNDAAIMPFITSANVACGYHAGDPMVMDKTVRLAASHGVQIGAHPGYPDLQGFGRRPMDINPVEVEALVLYQIAALAGFTRANGVELVHVKPHGSLYNQASTNRDLAAAVARGVARFSRDLVLVGLAGSVMLSAGAEAGLRVAAEAFADRAYNPDGSLRSRRQSGALIADPVEALAQAVRLAESGVTVALENGITQVPVVTLCLHGDNSSAPQIAATLRSGLERAGWTLKSL